MTLGYPIFFDRNRWRRTLTHQEAHAFQHLDVIVHFECVVELKYVFGSVEKADMKWVLIEAKKNQILKRHTCRWLHCNWSLSICAYSQWWTAAEWMSLAMAPCPGFLPVCCARQDPWMPRAAWLIRATFHFFALFVHGTHCSVPLRPEIAKNN